MYRTLKYTYIHIYIHINIYIYTYMSTGGTTPLATGAWLGFHLSRVGGATLDGCRQDGNFPLLHKTLGSHAIRIPDAKPSWDGNIRSLE